jgi:hypothetical protein
MSNKQVAKSKIFTPLNILIIITSLAIIGAGSYYLLNLSADTSMKSSINESHGKIIEYAGSKDGSSSGSASSKGSKGSDKPISKSNPASKFVISSNPSLTGSSGAGSGSDDPDEDENDGDKNDKIIKKASSTDVVSTEEDDSDDEEGDEEVAEGNDEGIYWVDGELQRKESPLVGSARP